MITKRAFFLVSLCLSVFVFLNTFLQPKSNYDWVMVGNGFAVNLQAGNRGGWA